ncbi:nuclear RNA polymerase D1B [Actinidia rufa]|uniref:Nuclear RNA polymerase D1B n=1 Tax=Actinidia rufa TaxID=165716 RepID=A0A7J0F8G0_9ERIC|nr:nuclear RNA polymerase D1B [Actinidia rufa]
MERGRKLWTNNSRGLVMVVVTREGEGEKDEKTLKPVERERRADLSDFPISAASQLANPFLGLPLESGKCESCGAAEPGKCEGMEVVMLLSLLLSDYTDRSLWVHRTTNSDISSFPRKRTEAVAEFSLLEMPKAEKQEGIGKFWVTFSMVPGLSM